MRCFVDCLESVPGNFFGFDNNLQKMNVLFIDCNNARIFRTKNKKRFNYDTQKPPEKKFFVLFGRGINVFENKYHEYHQM